MPYYLDILAIIAIGEVCHMRWLFPKIFKKNNANYLKDKFDAVEKELANNTSGPIVENVPLEAKTEEVYVEAKEGSIFEEEVFWWEKSENTNSSGNSLDNIEVTKKVERFLRSSKLYRNICSLESLSMSSCKDNDGKYFIEISWDSDYLNLSERRKYIEMIKDFMRSVDSKCETLLIHNHRRLSLSKRIGIKIIDRNDTYTKNIPEKERDQNL